MNVTPQIGTPLATFRQAMTLWNNMPKDMVYREGFHNAKEACERQLALTSWYPAQIKLGKDGEFLGKNSINKLCIMDNGDGMSAETLSRFGLERGESASGVDMEENYNFGFGFRTAAPLYQKLGIFIKSWRDGQGHMIWYVADYEEERIGLLPYSMHDDCKLPSFAEKNESCECDFKEVHPIPDEYKPDFIKDHGTVVTFLGDDWEDDTSAKPEALQYTESFYALAAYLNMRYFDLPTNIDAKAYNGLPRIAGEKHVVFYGDVKSDAAKELGINNKREDGQRYHQPTYALRGQKNAILKSDLLHRVGGDFVIESTVLNPDTELNMFFRLYLFRFDSNYWPPVGAARDDYLAQRKIRERKTKASHLNFANGASLASSGYIYKGEIYSSSALSSYSALNSRKQKYKATSIHGNRLGLLGGLTSIADRVSLFLEFDDNQVAPDEERQTLKARNAEGSLVEMSDDLLNAIGAIIKKELPQEIKDDLQEFNEANRYRSEFDSKAFWKKTLDSLDLSKYKEPQQVADDKGTTTGEGLKALGEAVFGETLDRADRHGNGSHGPVQTPGGTGATSTIPRLGVKKTEEQKTKEKELTPEEVQVLFVNEGAMEIMDGESDRFAYFSEQENTVYVRQDYYLIENWKRNFITNEKIPLNEQDFVDEKLKDCIRQAMMSYIALVKYAYKNNSAWSSTHYKSVLSPESLTAACYNSYLYYELKIKKEIEQRKSQRKWNTGELQSKSVVTV
tara:strand:- start:1880 stop:4087 length:2208 start_codon:yes stop_codon:yes gene_type:complete